MEPVSPHSHPAMLGLSSTAQASGLHQYQARRKRSINRPLDCCLNPAVCVCTSIPYLTFAPPGHPLCFHLQLKKDRGEKGREGGGRERERKKTLGQKRKVCPLSGYLLLITYTLPAVSFLTNTRTLVRHLRPEKGLASGVSE